MSEERWRLLEVSSFMYTLQLLLLHVAATDTVMFQ